jgi:uncharacterized membrane protein
MAAVTYLTRAGGLWIVGLLSETPRLSRVLQHLATGVLTALVVSGLINSDAAIAVAAFAAIVVMRLSGQFLTAIASAAAAAAAVRALGG